MCCDKERRKTMFLFGNLMCPSWSLSVCLWSRAFIMFVISSSQEVQKSQTRKKNVEKSRTHSTLLVTIKTKTQKQKSQKNHDR